MSDTQIAIASSSDTLFKDGTFSICPSPFFQVVFYSAKVGENTFPIATALLPNKLEATYRDVLELIRDVCEQNGKSVDFIYCHSDCEQGILNAVKAVFPNIQSRLCRFHVTDAIRRYANGIGLRSMIKRQKDLKDFYGRVQQMTQRLVG